jgi:hypothetical protein
MSAWSKPATGGCPIPPTRGGSLAGDKAVAGLRFCHLTRYWNQDGDFLQDPTENV